MCITTIDPVHTGGTHSDALITAMIAVLSEIGSNPFTDRRFPTMHRVDR
jgi:hypothetical protein